MVDNEKNPLDAISKRVIELIDSQWGLQTKLSKTVNKPASYFSEIKRGNPVNATQLLAIGRYFGPWKLMEIMGLNDINTLNTENLNPTVLEAAIKTSKKMMESAGLEPTPEQEARMITIMYQEMLKNRENTSEMAVEKLIKAVD